MLRRGAPIMAELLLELFSEEIPARMQARAAEDLERLIVDELNAAGLSFERCAASPRRAVWPWWSMACRRARPT